MGQSLADLSIIQASPLAIASLISGTADPPPGVVNWMPLSVSTV